MADGWTPPENDEQRSIPQAVASRIGDVFGQMRSPLEATSAIAELAFEGLTNVLRYPMAVARTGEVDPQKALRLYGERVPFLSQVFYDLAAYNLAVPKAARLAGSVIRSALGMNELRPIGVVTEGEEGAFRRFLRTPAVEKAVTTTVKFAPFAASVRDMIETYEAIQSYTEGRGDFSTILEETSDVFSSMFVGSVVGTVLGAAYTWMSTPKGILIPKGSSPGSKKVFEEMERARKTQSVPADLPPLWPGGWIGFAYDRFRKIFTDRIAPLETIERYARERRGGALPTEERVYMHASLALGGSPGAVGAYYTKIADEALRFRSARPSDPDPESFISFVTGGSPWRPSPHVGLTDPEDFRRFDVFAELVSRTDRALRGVDFAKDQEARVRELREAINDMIRSFPKRDEDAYRYVRTLMTLDRVRLNELYEKLVQYGLLTREDINLISKRPYYLAWRDVDYVWNNWGTIRPGRRLFATPADDPIDFERRSRGDATASMANLFEHDARLVELMMTNRVGLAMKALAEKDDTIKSIFLPHTGHPEINVPKGWSVWPVWEGGQVSYYRVPQFLRDSLFVYTPEAVSFAGNVHQRVGQRISELLATRMFRLGVTTFNIQFLLKNPFRDILNAMTTYDAPLAFIREWPAAFVDVLRSRFLGGGVPRAGTAAHQLYAAGGGIGAFFELGSERSVRTLRPEKAVFGEKRGFESIGDFFSTLGALSELPTRVALFRAERRRGKTLEEAAFTARTKAIDFSKAGDVSRLVSMFFPLVNARIQASLLSWNSFAENPEAFSFRLSLEAIPYFLAYAWNRWNYPDLYAKIPPEILDQNLVLIIGRWEDPRTAEWKPLYITYPLNEVHMAAFGALRHHLDRETFTSLPLPGGASVPLAPHQRTPRSDVQLWSRIFTYFFPFDIKPEDVSFPGIVTAVLTGQPLVGTTIQLWANRDYFTGRPIVDDDLLMIPEAYRYLRYDEQTSKTSRLVSYLMTKLGVGPIPIMPTTPVEIDFAVRNITGTSGLLALYAVDHFLEAVGFVPPEPRTPEELGFDPARDPPHLWMPIVERSVIKDPRPALARILPSWFRATGGLSSAISRAAQVSPQAAEQWRQTVQLMDAYHQWRLFNFNAVFPKIEKEHGYDWSNAKVMSEYISFLKSGRSVVSALRARYPKAIVDPAEREKFAEKLPGVPLDALESAAVMELPEPVQRNLAEYAARYWNPTLSPGTDPDDIQAVSMAREAEIKRMARELSIAYNTPIDPRVLRMAITAYTRGVSLPLLPVPSAWVKEWVFRYRWPLSEKEEKEIPQHLIGPLLGEFRRREVTRIAREYRIREYLARKWSRDPTRAGREPTEADAEAFVLETINTAMRSPDEAIPIVVSMEKALGLSSRLDDPRIAPPYLDPKTGRAVGDPVSWATWDRILEMYAGVDDAQLPQEVAALRYLRAWGRANRVIKLYTDPDAIHYIRFFGVGRNMTPAEWHEFMSRPGARYEGAQSKDEEMLYDFIIALYRALPSNDPIKTSMASQVSAIRRTMRPGWRSYIEAEFLDERMLTTLGVERKLYEERIGG